MITLQKSHVQHPALARLPEPIATCQMGALLQHYYTLNFLTNYQAEHLSHEQFVALLEHICSHMFHRYNILDSISQFCANNTVFMQKFVLQLHNMSIVEVIS